MLAHKLKKLDRIPSNHIKLHQETLQLLIKKSEYQKSVAKSHGVREKFIEKPSLKTIQNKREQQKIPDFDKTLEFYKQSYTQEKEHIDSIYFDKWINKIKKIEQNQQNQNTQIKTEIIEWKIEIVIKKSSPWKTPGPDIIPLGIYKALPTAKKYLIKYIREIIQGIQKITTKDVSGKNVLIYKSSDPSDLKNYRPLSLLNTDYKILTATITEIMLQYLPAWLIPTNQLARKGIWGTIQGTLWDKSITQTARMYNKKNYSIWFDFQKAFDSISQMQLIRLLKALPLHKNIKNTLTDIIKNWSVNITIGKQTTELIKIKIGILQGDSMRSLLFNLITASIINGLIEDPKLSKTTKGKLHIAAFADDIKVHVPTKKAVDETTTKMIQLA